MNEVFFLRKEFFHGESGMSFTLVKVLKDQSRVEY